MPDDYRDYLMRPYGRDPGEIRPYDVDLPTPLEGAIAAGAVQRQAAVPDRDAIQQHRRALTAGALYFLSATDGPIPADPLVQAVAADLDALLALADRLHTTIARIEAAAARAEPGTAAYECLDAQLGLLYPIAGFPHA
jgi:hypothetical protein